MLVQVNIYARTVVTLEGGSQTVESGQKAEFPCNVDVDPRLESSLNVTWLRNDFPLEENSSRISWDSRRLEVLATVSEDEGRYTCAVQSSHDLVAASGQLTVLHEGPSFTSTSIDVRVLEGGDTVLECQADGIPAPNISWSFAGRQLEAKESSLELQDMSRSREGEYVCTATNTYGEIKKSVNVAVIQGVQRETDNLVPDLVKNIKETILLPCDFKVDARVEKETEFQWLKDGSELDYKGNKFELLNNKSLVIKDLVLEDKAKYTCRVTNSLEETETHIQLIISGMGPHIMNDFRKVTVYEGEDLGLECIARGSPQPSLQWLVKEEPVVKKYLVDTQSAKSEFIEKRVKIFKATRAHEGLYQCIASNSMGTVVKNAQVEVISRTIVRIASSTEEGNPEISVQAGRKLKLPCSIEHDPSNQITSLVWTKDSEEISPGGEDRIDYGMDGSLTIFDVEKRHEGRYRCTVGTKRDTAFAEVPLTVVVNAPQITKHSPDTRVFSGTSLSLQCSSSGIPEPEVRWSLNETMTEAVGEEFSINAAIAGVDSGRYVCTATNSVGRTEKRIEVAIVTLPNLETEYRVKKGKRLALPCLPSSPAIHTVWKKEEEELEGDTEGRLVLHNMNEEREGDYSCHVTIRESGESRVLQTSIKIIPDIVTTESQRVEVREGEEFQLKCDVMPGINAKRMWMKDGAMVAFESEGRLHFEDNGGTVAVRRAKLGDQVKTGMSS